MKRLALAVIACVAAISLLSSLGYGTLFNFVNRIPGRDTTGHFALMGLVAFCVVLGFAGSRPWGRTLGASGCTLLVLGAVTLEEIVQVLIPARSFSLTDLFASYGGILLAGLAGGMILRVRQR